MFARPGRAHVGGAVVEVAGATAGVTARGGDADHHADASDGDAGALDADVAARADRACTGDVATRAVGADLTRTAADDGAVGVHAAAIDAVALGADLAERATLVGAVAGEAGAVDAPLRVAQVTPRHAAAAQNRARQASLARHC